jgi:hypothetical protein
MFRRVMLARFLSVIRGVQMAPVRNVGVMSGLFGITGFVMFGSFTIQKVSYFLQPIYSRLTTG